MIDYDTVSAFDAHNLGLLAAVRGTDTELSPPEELWSDTELRAWHQGVAEGRAIRAAFEPPAHLG